ncbi:Neurobeachin [Lotmaria passim]
MYHYLINVFGISRANGAASNDSAAAAAADAAAEAARVAQRREEERLRRLLVERRRAYVEFVSGSALGQLLAPQLPPADAFTTASGKAAPTPTSAASRSGLASPLGAAAGPASAPAAQEANAVQPGSHPLTSSFHDVTDTGASAALERALYTAIAPHLSRGTTIVTARVLELLGRPNSAPAHNTNSRNVDGAAALREELQLELPKHLPFLFVSLLLQRWQVCLHRLAADLLDRTPSPRTLCTLRSFSCILTSLVAVTEVYTEEVRAYLEDLRMEVTQSVEESLRCLHLLTRACLSSAFHVCADAEASELPSDQRSASAQDDATVLRLTVPRDEVSTEAEQVQVWRLLSLLLYWMHMLHGAPVPHLNVVNAFLSTSTAALDPMAVSSPHKSTRNKARKAESIPSSSIFDEADRCTGLNNAALLHQTYLLPGTATASPPMWLVPVTGKDSGGSAASPVTAARSSGATTTSLANALVSSVKVRESLLALLLTASKGVVSNVVPGSSHYLGLFKKFANIEVDHDLGFVVVLTCRLLHYAFVTCASTLTAAEQVRVAVSPLLGALSILLARLIAEEHGQDVPDGGVYGGGESRHADPAAPFLASPGDASAAAVGDADVRGSCSPPDLLVLRHPRDARLLGQLGCGILLLTTLFQQSAQSVLEALDHSFFFDALVTALQAVGKRFTEPSLALSSSSLPQAGSSQRARHGDAAAQAWSMWVEAVDTAATDGAVPCDYRDLAPLDVLLNAALLRPVDDYLAVLSGDPIVDEFLHAYLGLLASCRRLRVAPAAHTLLSPGMSANSSSPNSNQSLRLEARSLDTLDQLEQTLVKTFLTAYDVADAIPAASAIAGCVNETLLQSWTSAKDEGDEGREKDERDDLRVAEGAAAASSPFPATSCLYNLLLKHALWCLRMARQHRRDAQSHALLHSAPTRTFPFSALTGSPGPSSLAAHLSPGLSLTSPGFRSLLSPPPPPSHSLTSTPSAGRLNSPFTTPVHGAAAAAATNAVAAAAAADFAVGQDDPFLLFLVHHGLFRILLHDEHYASAFMVEVPQKRAVQKTARGNSEADPEKGPSRDTSMSWQRAYVTLLLVSYCLQLRPSLSCEPIPISASAMDAEGPVSNSTSPSSHSAPAAATDADMQNGATEGLVPSEELLAYETAEALVIVLRPPSYSSSSSLPPAALEAARAAAAATKTTSAAAPARSGSLWRNCLLALLAAALDVTAELKQHSNARDSTRGEARQQQQQSRVTAAAAPVVCEALMRCGGTEYFLQASVASAAVASPRSRDVSFRWTMCVLRGLVSDPQARVHMSATCAKPLLLGVLWNPLLRAAGRELLTSLLCQPLLHSYSTAVASGDAREAAAMTFGPVNRAGVGPGGGSPATASDSGALAAATSHAVPRHCRKLCESLWRVLNECVNGPLPTNAVIAEAYFGVSVGGGGVGAPLASASAFPSAAIGTDKEREAVLQAVLSALVDAFRILGSDNAHGLDSAEELLPLRTLQRGIFEASREGSMHVYALLLHRLAQSWRSNASSPTSLSSAASFSLPPPDSHGTMCVLFAADDSFPTGTATTAAAAEPSASAHTSREIVILIVKVLVGLTKADPAQRAVLYRNTIDEEALVDCVANAWAATVHCAARGDATLEESGLVRLCSYLAYESIDALDAFLDNQQEQEQQQPLPDSVSPCAWSLQNSQVLSALLRRFTKAPLTPAQQCALRQLLRTLAHTVACCQTSLYLAASSSLHEMLGQLLPVVALLPSTAAMACLRGRSSFSASASTLSAPAPLRLDAVLVDLLVMLTRCHIDVRQLKQLLMLVIHSQPLRERRALVPLLLQLLSAAAQPPAAVPDVSHNRTPHHFLTLHRGSGPAGFRAALQEFPLEGYSVSLYLRWEGELGSERGAPAAASAVVAADEDAAGISFPIPDTAAPRQTSETTHGSTGCSACVFSLRTADRVTALALMVERHTGRFFVQYRNLQQQEMRADVAAVLPSREWSQVILSHRPATFLSTAAGGQLHITVNDRDPVTVPQVAYPLMSRGHLYVGCLGHEVDRLSVAHAFYGQVFTAYFFPFVLTEREREILQGAAQGSDQAVWMAASTSVGTPPLRTATVSASGGGTAGVGGIGASGSSDAGSEQWLADRATLRVDTRLSDRGHLYNLAAVLRGRAGRDSRPIMFEGTLVCSTQSVMDSMGLLGALPSVVMPLCTLLVNPTLPISLRGLVSVPPSGSEPPALPAWVTAVTAHSSDAYDPATVDAANAGLLWVLELVPALAASEAIHNEMADSGLFVFFGQVLQLLGPSLHVVVPAALLRLLEALVPLPRLFEAALTNLFLSSEVIHAAPRTVQRAWVSVQNTFLRDHPDALSCLRSLGTSMFVATEVLRVTAEEESETGAAPPSSPECSLADLEHQWMSYFEALTAPPATISEAQSLQHLVENLRWTCRREAVQLRILRRVRQLVASTASPFFVQLLGRKNYVVTLIPYIKESPSEAVRMEALVQLLCMVFRSKRTQELMNPVLLASRETVVHVAEEVSLSWLKDVLCFFAVDLPVYLALRCGLVGRFDTAELPTSYVPLDESDTLKFAAVLLPLLMLLKRSNDAKLKAYVLTDLAVLLKSDAQAWRRVITVRGWYVSLASLFASPCAATAQSVPTSPNTSEPATVDHAEEEQRTAAAPPLRSTGLLFTTTSMILSYTLFQVLLHESYGANELAMVATHLREQRLHRLLHQVLCNIADRYRSRLLAQRVDRRRLGTGTGSQEDIGEVPSEAQPTFFVQGGGGTSSSASAAAAAASYPGSFLGLGTPVAVLNICYFFHVVEATLFYSATPPRREAAATTPTPASSMTSLPLQSSSSSPEGFVLKLPTRGSYTEWEELTLLPPEPNMAAGCSSYSSVPETSLSTASHGFGDVYYAGKDDDPQGNVRRAVLCNPDGRWLHLPLAVKCAELLCSHSALLHLGSNGNTTSISLSVSGGSGGGGSAVVGAPSSSGGPGDALLATVVSAAAGTSSVLNGVYMGKVGPPVLKGGLLRLFGRLLHVICRMTLRCGNALESIIDLIDGFVARVDREQRGGGFLLLKRAVNADEAHEHSPIAVSMTIVYDIHELLLRRLHAAEYGGSRAYPNANAALVDRMKSLVEIFRYSFEQLPAFAAASASRRASPTPAQATSPHHHHSCGDSGKTSSFLDDVTGEVYTAGVSTLQWLCDHQANPRRTVEAFAEVASRADYNAFVERCLISLEREQSTNKALAGEMAQEQHWMLRRLQDLFCENSLSRRLVQDNIKAVMASSAPARREGGSGGGGGRDDGVSTTTDESTDTSFTSFFLPSAAKKVAAAARATTWAHFTTALRGTVWNLEGSGPQQQQQQQQPQQHPTSHSPGTATTAASASVTTAVTKYVKLSAQEQQALVHRKLVFDREGMSYSGVSMACYSSPPSPVSENTSMGNAASLATDTVFGDDTAEVDLSVGSASRASRLRLRGGEAVLLQPIPEDDDAAAEEDLLRLSAEEDMRSFTAASLNEFLSRDTPALEQLRRGSSSAAAPYDPAVQSVLSVPCEVPYMMHCWSASFTVRGSEAFVLIDDENKAYNQVVSEDAKPYLLRPRTFSFHLSHLTQIAPGRRFRMRRTALEVWTRDRRSYFINFADAATMNAALQALRTGGAPRYPAMTPSLLRSATGVVTATLPGLIRQVAGGGSQHTVYVLQENPRREPMRLRAMALWRHRLLSNFDYLLVLNLLAGRTLNDITQYPVFPWILSDYTSSELDLTNPATFRDLSLPMGACGSEERRAVVRERYTEMKDLGDVPSHYFTHYSSPAVTLYFLIRLPPYTTLSILLQGGHFDHADRMFHSVQASFKAVTTSTQDVRELIPELFYLPELCLNANHVNFGRRQDWTPMDDLQLPPWAHNDPYTFTYRMREALESPYVSAHLHEWIDLIFGYKQRGKDAIDALNVFNWHSYEELDKNRDASSIDHQLLIDSLDNIGQTPIQLFRQPHQSRPALEWADPLLLSTQVKVLPLRWGCVRVAKVVVLATDKVLVVTGNGGAAVLRMHLNLIRSSAVPRQATIAGSVGGAAAATGPGSTGHAQDSGGGDGGRSPELLHRGPSLLPERTSHGAFRPGSHHGSPLLVPGAAALSSVGRASVSDAGSFDVSEEYERRLAPIPAGVIPNNSPYADGSSTASNVALLCYDTEVFLVLGGLFDNSVAIRSLAGAGGDVRLRAHHGRVTFVVRSGDSRYLVTGAEDTTFVVWSCHLRPDRQQLDVELLFTIYGHKDIPSAADVSSTLDLVATASLDGALMLHSLSTGSLDRVLRHPHNAPIHRVLLQTNCYVPNVVFLSNHDGCVHQYSVNGTLLRTFTPPGRVTAWAVTPSQHFLLACQPHPYMHTSVSPTRHTPPPAVAADAARQAAMTTPCILYVHSFFLEIVKTVPVPADHVVSTLSAHPLYPQVVVAGTESDRLLLLRSVTS